MSSRKRTTEEKAAPKEDLRLYNLRRDKGIKIHFDGLLLEFHHIDGMYSYCTVLEGEHKGKICHLSAMAPLEKVRDGVYRVTK